MLSAQEQASIEATLAAFLNESGDTCDILRETRALTASGGFTTTYVKHNASPLPCVVVSSGSPQEALTAGQIVGSVPEYIFLPKGTDVLGSDRIQINGATTYHVIDFDEPTFQFMRRVLVRRASLVG